MLSNCRTGAPACRDEDEENTNANANVVMVRLRGVLLWGLWGVRCGYGVRCKGLRVAGHAQRGGVQRCAEMGMVGIVWCGVVWSVECGVCSTGLEFGVCSMETEVITPNRPLALSPVGDTVARPNSWPFTAAVCGRSTLLTQSRLLLSCLSHKS